MRIGLLLILLLGCLLGNAQVRPDDFPFESNPTDANFEFYSQKGGVNTKTNISAFRGAMLPTIGIQVSYIPAPSGNATNRGEFVWGADGELYYIDAQGRSAKFVSNDQADQETEIFGPLSSGNTIIVARPLPADIDRIKVARGIPQVLGVDYQVDGQRLVFVQRNFQHAEFITVTF